MTLLSRKDIQASHLEKWMEVCFNKFESSITNKIRPFPCIFGVKGFLKDQLRYIFMDEATPENIAPYLKQFVDNSRQYFLDDDNRSLQQAPSINLNMITL